MAQDNSTIASNALTSIAPQSGAAVAIDTPAPGGHILTVGVDGEFTDLWDAIAAAQDNDVIAVQAGTYIDDSNSRQNGYVNAKNVTIEGVGGMVHIEEPAGQSQPYNDKAPIVAENGLTVKNLEISGVTARALNGAGIRVDNGDLTVEDCYFYDDQNGILTSGVGNNITVDHTEFADNGTGYGQAHNIYVSGNAASFTFTNNYTHDSVGGHLIKSRAAVTTIENNVIADQQGTGSYDIDIPNAGDAVIENNIIEKGPNTVNQYAIHYGGENQFSYPTNSALISGNTILYDRGSYSGPVAVLNQSDITTGEPQTPITVDDNAVYGLPDSDILDGAGTVTNTTDLTSEPAVPTADPFADAPVIQGPTAPLTLTLDSGIPTAHGISGGSSGATIVDDDSNVIDSGPVGINLTENSNIATTITTEAGSQNTLTLNAGGDTVTSAGTDVINSNSLYTNVTASGDSTINVTQYGVFTLLGKETVIAPDASDNSYVLGSNADATITQTGNSADIVKTAGAQLTLNQTGDFYGTLNSASLVAAGGQVELKWDSRTLTAASQDGSADTFTYQGGNVVITSGTGAASYTVDGQGTSGTLEVQGFKVGTDTLSFQNFAGTAVSSATETDGNTVLTLSNGETVQVDGVALTPDQYAPAPNLAQDSSFGSAADTLTVNLSEDAYQGDAQALITVDGKILTSQPITVTALHAQGQSQAFTFQGNFGTGQHTVGVSFLNDAWGGTASTDRNLYVDGVTLNGQASPDLASGSTEMPWTMTDQFGVSGGTNPTPAPAKQDTLTLDISEDAWQGDAQFTIQVDGKTIGDPQTAFALHAIGQSQAYAVQGDFGAGPHQVTVMFLNDAYGGSSTMDRNLYLDGVDFDGKSFLNQSTELPWTGSSKSVVVDSGAAGLGTQHVFTSPQPSIVLPLT